MYNNTLLYSETAQVKNNLLNITAELASTKGGANFLTVYVNILLVKPDQRIVIEHKMGFTISYSGGLDFFDVKSENVKEIIALFILTVLEYREHFKNKWPGELKSYTELLLGTIIIKTLKNAHLHLLD